METGSSKNAYYFSRSMASTMELEHSLTSREQEAHGKRGSPFTFNEGIFTLNNGSGSGAKFIFKKQP